jgi:hypothetical protein
VSKVRPILRQTSKLFQLGEAIELSRSRAALFGDSFDPFILSSIASKGIEGQPSGGTGTGSSSGGSGGSGASAGAVPTAASSGAGTVGLANAPHLYPTPDFRNFDKGPNSVTGVVALPAIGATATILTWVVDNGRNGKITQLGIDYVIVPGSGAAVFTQGLSPAQLIFSITSNGKTIFKDYEQFSFSPGAVSAPTPINGLMLKENNVIAITVKNVSIVVSAGNQFLSARAVGYTFSKNLMPPILGLQ